MKADKMTMAHSVEGRVPFLDHKFVEYSFKIPTKLKLNGRKDKYIVKKAMKDILPKEIFKRKKQRFYVPIDLWIKNDLKDYVSEVLSEETIRNQGIFNYNYIKKIFDKYDKSGLFYARQLWNLITFQTWYNLYIEGSIKIKNKPISLQ